MGFLETEPDQPVRTPLGQRLESETTARDVWGLEEPVTREN